MLTPEEQAEYDELLRKEVFLDMDVETLARASDEPTWQTAERLICLLYTSDAADD